MAPILSTAFVKADAALVADILPALNGAVSVLPTVNARDFDANNNVLRLREDDDFELSSVGENSAIPDVNPTESSITVTAGKGAARAGLTLEAQVFRENGSFTRLDPKGAEAAGRWMDGEITALFSSFTNTAGTTGTPIDESVIRIALQTLDLADVPAPWIVQLHKNQLHEIQDDLLTQTTVPFQSQINLDLITDRTASNGFVGTLYGAPIYTSTLIPDDTTDYSGAVYHPDAIGFGMDPNIYVLTETDSTNAVYYKAWAVFAGAAIRSQARAVQLISGV